MRRGLNATRSPSPRAPSRLSGPSPSPSSLLVASLAHSLSDSLSTDLEGKKKTCVLLVFGFFNRQRLCWLYFLCKSNKKISETDLNHLSLQDQFILKCLQTRLINSKTQIIRKKESQKTHYGYTNVRTLSELYKNIIKKDNSKMCIVLKCIKYKNIILACNSVNVSLIALGIWTIDF